MAWRDVPRLGTVLAVTLLVAPAAGRSERPNPELLGHVYAGTTAGYAPRFLYDSDHFAAHYVERADRSVFDLPTARRTVEGRTVDVGTVAGTRDGGNAGAEFQRFAHPGSRIAVVDSFARPFAYLLQDAANPEAVEVLTERGDPFDATFPEAAPSDPDGALVPAADPTKLFVQGLGCMADPALHARYAIVGLQSGNATAPGDAANPPDVGVLGHEIGIRGFVAVADLPHRIAGQATGALLAGHDVGCAPADLDVVPGDDGLRELPEAQAWDRFGDVYLGSRSWTACPVSSGRPNPESPYCGTPYAQYQSPPQLTPPGDGISLLTANTTGVTGIHAGVVRAIYRAGEFRQVDEIGYADPNVPCAPSGGSRDRTARWVFGDANPHPAPGQTHIWGWRVERVGEPPGGTWPALFAGSPFARRCGATGTAPAPAQRGPLRRCPPAGTRILRSGAAATVYAAGSRTWVCDRRSRSYEELDDPAIGEHVQRGPALDLAGPRVVAVVTDAFDERPGHRRVLDLLDVPAFVGAAGRPAVLEVGLAAGRVGSARVYRSGAAYIACAAGPPRTCGVHVVTGPSPPRDRMVASGRRIVPGSLRVRHGRLHWSVRR